MQLNSADARLAGVHKINSLEWGICCRNVEELQTFSKRLGNDFVYDYAVRISIVIYLNFAAVFEGQPKGCVTLRKRHAAPPGNDRPDKSNEVEAFQWKINLL